MNTIQNSQVKRSIRVKDFLDDFHAGMTDEGLLEKYHLTPTGLERFYDMLQDRGIIDPEELLIRYSESSVVDEVPVEEGETTSYICPSCLASHKTMFDICPDCGVSFQDMISKDSVQGQDEMTANSDAPEAPDHIAAATADPCKASEPGEQINAGEISEEPESINDYFVDPSEMREHDRFSWPGEIDSDRSASDEFASVEKNEFRDPGSEGPSSRAAFSAEDTTPKPLFSAFEAERESMNSSLTESAGAFDDSFDELGSAPRFESFLDEPDVHRDGKAATLCESCDEMMEPALRDIYDRKRSHFALMLAGACLVLGFLGFAAVSLFDGYSLARLFVVYTTGMWLLFGAILTSVGAFMYLARERVYCCSSCRRVYPRR